jgi:hypothetical protein
MLKFLVLLVQLALLLACGNQELPTDGLNELGNKIELRQLSAMSASEKLNMADLCRTLAQKETNFQQFYADKGIRFQFETKHKRCGQTQGVSYLVMAQVEHHAGKMIFAKQSSNIVMFSDILLRNSGLLKELCDIAEGQGGIEERYREVSNRATIVYLRKQGTQFELVIDTAQKFGQSSLYEVLVKDYFLIESSSSINQGVVSKRVQTSSVACSLGSASELVSVLKKIN